MTSLLEAPSAQHIREQLATLTALEARVVATIFSQSTLEENSLLKVVAAEMHVSEAR